MMPRRELSVRSAIIAQRRKLNLYYAAALASCILAFWAIYEIVKVTP